MKTFLLSLIGLLVYNYSTSAQDVNYSFKESYKVAVPAQLVISSDDGNIEVLPSDQNSIEVYYIVKKNNVLLKSGRAEIEKELTLEATTGVNSLKIHVKYPKSLRRFEINNGITASIKIYVPKQTACNLETADGNVLVSGLLSDQLVKTSDGNITLEGIVGNVSSLTLDGNIKATKIRGDLSLKTSDGDIELLTIAGAVTAITSEGNIRGNVSELQRRLSLTTGEGNIAVTIPDRLGLNLDIKGGSIKTILNDFSGKSGKHLIQGQLNGGGIPIKLKSSEGNISLNYR